MRGHNKKSGNKGNILIVEDDFVTAFEFKLMLESEKYSVCSIVSTGEKAIMESLKHIPDAIIMDISLAGNLDGVETALKINRLKPIPILFLTGYGNSNLSARINEKCCFSFLTKPIIDSVEISNAIGKLLLVNSEKMELLSTNLNISRSRII